MTDREYYLERIQRERSLFIAVLKALPADRLEYQPHPKSRSARELVGHLIGHVEDVLEMIEHGAVHQRTEVAFGTLEDGIAMFERACTALEQGVQNVSAATWDERIVPFKVGGRQFGAVPFGKLAWNILFDSIQHRGQLTVYIRPMGGQVPRLYGPSADFPPENA